MGQDWETFTSLIIKIRWLKLVFLLIWCGWLTVTLVDSKNGYTKSDQNPSSPFSGCFLANPFSACWCLGKNIKMAKISVYPEYTAHCQRLFFSSQIWARSGVSVCKVLGGWLFHWFIQSLKILDSFLACVKNFSSLPTGYPKSNLFIHSFILPFTLWFYFTTLSGYFFVVVVVFLEETVNDLVTLLVFSLALPLSSFTA